MWGPENTLWGLENLLTTSSREGNFAMWCSLDSEKEIGSAQD